MLNKLLNNTKPSNYAYLVLVAVLNVRFVEELKLSPLLERLPIKIAQTVMVMD